MKVVAAVAWFDEPVGFLERLVASLAGAVDVVVGVDGPWRLFPHAAHLEGHVGQRAIRVAAERAGLECEVYASLADWRSQVQKRDRMMQWAGEHGDWVLVIDGDEFLEQVDGVAFRARLAATELGVAEVTVRTLNRPWPLSHLAPMAVAHRRIYRAGTRVPGPAHNCYRRGDGWLNGDRAQLELAPSLDLADVVKVAHDNGARPRARRDAALAYRRARRAHGVEVYA